MNKMLKTQLVLIGCGELGSAMLRGFCNESILDPDNIVVFDVFADKVDALSQELGVRSGESLEKEVLQTDVLLLSVKPKDTCPTAKQLSSVIQARDKPLDIISVAAGVRIDSIAQAVDASNVSIVRAMPNLPARIGQAMTCIFSERAEAADLASELFSAVGEVCQLNQESEIDAATALAGSGPGFVAAIIDSFVQGGERCGLNEKIALQLALQTFYGTTKLLMDEKIPPKVLADEVATPEGTTAAGMSVLSEKKVDQACIETIVAAAKRAKELADLN